jgi:hypothetical protein
MGHSKIILINSNGGFFVWNSHAHAVDCGLELKAVRRRKQKNKEIMIEKIKDTLSHYFVV